MFYDASGDDVDFPSFEPYQKTQDEPEPPQNKKKKCIIIIVVIIVILILITGIFLGIFFGLKKKQNGGSIIVQYAFKENDKVIDLFNKGNLDEKDYEIKLISNNTLQIRDLSSTNNDQTTFVVAKEGTYEFEIKFKKIITSMEGMFKNKPELKSADFSKLVSKKIINMNNLFSNCTNLEEVIFNNFDAKKLETMDNCFENCSNIVVLDLNSFITPKLKSMNSAFNGCTNLIFLDIKNFIIDSNVNINNFIDGCKSLDKVEYPSDNNNNDLNNQIEITIKKNNHNEIKCVENNECLKCGNKTISNNYILSVCDTCNDMLYKSSFSEYNTKCQKCLDNCKICENNIFCIECIEGYKLEDFNKSCIINETIPTTNIIPNPTDETDQYLY